MYGPMSPQSSDSGHSMNDGIPPHMSAHAYAQLTKAQQQHHKELFSQRKQREFTPDNKKDDSYWDRRRRNNEAAKRSREKRRYNDMVLEQRVVELTKENHVLKAQLDAIRDKFNISGENLVSVEQILASLPTSEQVLSITKRAKISNSSGSSVGAAANINSSGNAATKTNAAEAAAVIKNNHHLQNATAGHLPFAAHHQIPNFHHENYAAASPAPTNVQTGSAQHHHNLPAAALNSVVAAASTTSAEHTTSHLHPNLHVLQALNRGANVSSDDLDNLRKVVAVVGAVAAAELPNVSALYAATPQQAAALYAAAPSPQNYAEVRSYATPMETSVSSSAVEAVTSSSAAAGSALNLSRHASSPSYEHMLSSTTSSSSRNCSSLSSASSSGAVSGDDEHETADDHHVNVPSDANNCLPLKLRHKSHLGDKDAAATALLALQHIKQEPISHRSSPPAWADGGDNSSDERDSGISIGSAEWTAHFQQRKMVSSPSKALEVSATTLNPAEQEALKSKLARLESEVANMKNMMMLTAVTEATKN